MRPLTDRTPKPLLRAGGRSLIEWQILRLAAAGVCELVVNVSHLGEQVVALLGNGAPLGVSIEYSREQQALETAGGIVAALPLLGPGAFIAVNADIYCDYDYARLRSGALRADDCAHLVLVDNPEHHRSGDFAPAPDGRLRSNGAPMLTFSGIAVYRPAFFAGIVPGERVALGPLLHAAAREGRLSGEHHRGLWMDIGTPERLARLQRRLACSAAAPGARVRS